MLLLGSEEDLRKLYEADAKMMLEDDKQDAKKKSASKEKQKDREKD
jgi:hypothetical protein